MEMADWMVRCEVVGGILLVWWWILSHARLNERKEERMYRAILGIQVALQSINIQLQNIAPGTGAGHGDHEEQEWMF